MYIDTGHLLWEPEDLLDGIEITHLVTLALCSKHRTSQLKNERAVYLARVNRRDAVILSMRTSGLTVYTKLVDCFDTTEWEVDRVRRVRGSSV